MFFDKIKKTSNMPDSSPDPDLKLIAKGGPVYGKKISEPEH